VVVELADDIVPITVGNFLALCARPEGRGYAGSAVIRAQRDFAVFCGDFERGDRAGRGSHSSFPARFFPDENFIGTHSVPGVLAMASGGVHSNGSVFYITLAPAPHLGAFSVGGGEGGVRPQLPHTHTLENTHAPRAPPTDGRCVVFGTVLIGMDTIARIGAASQKNLRPSPDIVIAGAGVLLPGSAAWAAVDADLAKRGAAAAPAKKGKAA
jgi:cyclophilin family peptidyl-prolyl cis-trans isomerase